MGLKLYMQLSYKTSDWLYHNEKQFNTMQFNYEEGKGCVVLEPWRSPKTADD